MITGIEGRGKLPRKPKVLFLRSNPIDPDPRVEKAASSLAEAGYSVEILGWDRTATGLKNGKIGQIPVSRLMIRAGYGMGIQNFPALLRWQWGCIRWMINHQVDFDIIHACDFDTVIPALWMKLLWKKKVVYDIFDFYADHLRSTPTWIKGIIRFVDKKCIGIVDGIILVDDSRRMQISGSKPKRCVVIYNSPEDVRASLSKKEIIPEVSPFHLVYVGLLQVERGIFEFLEIMGRHPEWRMSLAGFGGDETQIRKRISRLGNVTWYGRVSYDRALELSHEADVLLATYDPSILNHRYASPNKVFEAMMLGKPIIVARGTNIDQIIEEHQFGLVVDYSDVEGLDQVLIRLSGEPDLIGELGRNARKAYERQYSWSEMETRLKLLYSDLLV